MKENKIKNLKGLRQLGDNETEKVNGGMKIVIFEEPSFITRFLKLIFKVKDRK